MKLNIQLFADGKITIETEVDNKGLRKGLDDIESKAKSFSEGFAGVAGTIGKAFLKASAVAGAAMAGMVAKGVQEYGKLEQSIGGVETLFKDSADTVIANAKKAYETAGVDANRYMEQVTSFSASLLQATGGDTVKAAKTADMAIIDMADNANKMGTSIEMIQNAYQGFAKQNYMMLDNLKLGYGGTKTEMERLLADAEKITGIHYDISNLDDVYQAIHVIQGELGITGTTAEEASSTIQGSAASMKAAFTNFLSGAGGIEDVIDTVKTFGTNIIKAAKKLAPQLIKGVVELVNAVIKELPSLISTLLPPIIDGIVSLADGIIQAIPQLISALSKMIPVLIPQLIKGLTTIITSLSQQLPKIIPMLITAILDGLLSILDNIDLLIDAGIELIIGLADGLIQAIPILIEKAPEIITKLVTKLTDPDMIAKMIQAAGRLIIALASGIIKTIPKLLEVVPKIRDGFINGLKNINQAMKDAGKNLIKGLWEGIKSKWNDLKKGIEDLGKGIVKQFKSVFGIHSPSTVMRDMIGKNLAEGIGVGFEKDIDDVYRNMQHAINLEQAKLQANVETGSVFNTLNNSTPIQINVNADVEMDSTKVGRLITPSISETLKTGGIR